MSSYGGTLPVGSAEATGAYAVAIAAQPGSTNNNGTATDSAGNLRIDRVWGNFPMLPNDERAGAVSPANYAANSAGDKQWGATTRVASGRLDAGLDNHANVEAGWAGYPSYTPAVGSYMVTQAVGNGTTIRYESFNFLAVGDVVNITNCGNLNLSGATVASVTRDFFTVTNGTVGDVFNISGKVESTTARTAYDGAGIGSINVPNVVGRTIAVALDTLRDAGYEAANITTASAHTPAVFTVALESNVATLTTGDAHGYAVGDSVVIAGLVDGAGDASTDASLNGTYTLITGTTGIYLLFAKTLTDIVYHAGLSGVTAKVSAKAGTIKTQSVAAGTASVLTTATITVTPYFAS